MNNFILYFIKFIHLLLIIFICYTPFTQSNYLLLIHIIIIPFIILHWLLNDDTCILTEIEKNILKKKNGKVDEKYCFTCQLISPVYNVHNNYKTFKCLIYFITIFLWCKSVEKLYRKYKSGQIKSWRDLYII